jgi:hypothetical protein
MAARQSKRASSPEFLLAPAFVVISCTDCQMPEKVVHRLAEIIRFRMMMIAAGYEDGNDANTLRADPMFKLAVSVAATPPCDQ